MKKNEMTLAQKIYRKSRLWVILLLVVIFPLIQIPKNGKMIFLADNYLLHMANISMMFAILTISLNILSGFTGLMSVGHIAFFGIGAYSAAILTTKAGMPILVGFIAAGVISALFSLILGLPTMRLRGMYFSVATMAFGEIIYQLIKNLEPLTGGTKGITKIPSIEIFGISFKDYRNFYYLMLLGLVLVIVLTQNLKNSRPGRAMLAIRANDIAAEAMGVNVVSYKLVAFMASAFFAGIAGAFYAHEMRYISPETFASVESASLLAMMVVGGIGSIPGAILGGAALTILPEVLRFIGEFRLVLYGAAVVAIIIFAPKGLGGLITWIDETLSGQRAKGSKHPSEAEAGEEAQE